MGQGGQGRFEPHDRSIGMHAHSNLAEPTLCLAHHGVHRIHDADYDCTPAQVAATVEAKHGQQHHADYTIRYGRRHRVPALLQSPVAGEAVGSRVVEALVTLPTTFHARLGNSLQAEDGAPYAGHLPVAQATTPLVPGRTAPL